MKGKLRGQRESMISKTKMRKISRHADEREAQNPAKRTLIDDIVWNHEMYLLIILHPILLLTFTSLNH